MILSQSSPPIEYVIYPYTMQNLSPILYKNGKLSKAEINTNRHQISNNHKVIKIHRFYKKKQNDEVILGINTNKPNILYNYGVSQILQRTNLIDIFDHKQGTYNEPNTHIRRRHRIDYIFCTEYISSFIDRSGHISFNEVTTSDHR